MGAEVIARSKVVRVLGTLGATLLVPIIPFAVLGELPGDRWLSGSDDHAGAFAAIGALLLSLDVLLPIPSSVVGVMLGARLGLGLGFVCTLAGLLAGHAAGYWLGRLAPARWGAALPSAPTVVGIALTRPVPVLAEAVTLAAGALRVPWPRFALATLLGDAVYAAALAASGATLLPEGWLLTSLALPALLGLAGWLAFRRRSNVR
jgi:uncharacterized membrane protein YdjX (TVP38/TMEM64 family)